MGKDPNEERERRSVRRRGRAVRHVADWGTANGAKLVSAIAAAANVGGALRFGYSRDGGAFAIGVYGDGEPYTDFVPGVENIDDALDDYVDLFESLKDDIATSSSNAKQPTKPKNGA